MLIRARVLFPPPPPRKLGRRSDFVYAQIGVLVSLGDGNGDGGGVNADVCARTDGWEAMDFIAENIQT